jgi:hypothetical protein
MMFLQTQVRHFPGSGPRSDDGRGRQLCPDAEGGEGEAGHPRQAASAGEEAGLQLPRGHGISSVSHPVQGAQSLQ